MSTLITGLELVGGLVALTAGASVFVDGASGLARRFHISPLIIGLTIVALGTSAPEIGVNVVAAFADQPGLAVGNVVGSNIFNILAVLGLCALVAPLLAGARIIRVDVPVMLAATAALWAFAADGRIATWESGLLVVALGVYTGLQIRGARRERRDRKAAASEASALEALPPERPLLVQLGAIVVGGGLLVLGSDWLVSGAIAVAAAVGVDDRIIGLTVVALGTSLPELAASLIATIKGERDLAVGNVVGSNIYNLLAVVGLTGLIATGGIEVASSALQVDFPVLFAASVACLPVFFVGGRIARWEGGLFLFAYLAYLAFLVLDASGHAFAHTFAAAAPIAALLGLATAGALWARELKARRA